LLAVSKVFQDDLRDWLVVIGSQQYDTLRRNEAMVDILSVQYFEKFDDLVKDIGLLGGLHLEPL
jgi:hypothetical protein